MTVAGAGAPRRTPTALMMLVVAPLLLPLTACDSSYIDGVPEGPVSDAELFAQISEIDQVIKHDVHYTINATDGDSYTGAITVEVGADPYCILDQATSILWMGRDTDLVVWVRYDGDGPSERTAPREVGPARWWAELEERYGPRPEPGSDPTPAPAPACA